MPNPPYSVVIPAYNAEKYLSEALISVLNQTIKPEVIFVVDDGSTDSTVHIAQHHGPLVKVISTENRGSGAATTTGIKHVITPIVATIDSDDLWLPHKMETQLAYLTDLDQSLDAVLCRLEPFGETNKMIATTDNSGWSRSSLTIWVTSFWHVGAIVDMGNNYGEMIDWFARAKETGLNFSIMEQPLVKRRMHSDSLSAKADEKQRMDFLKAAMRAVQRKRQRAK